MKKVTETTKKSVALESAREFVSLSKEEKLSIYKEMKILVRDSKLSMSELKEFSNSHRIEISIVKDLYKFCKENLKKEKC